MRDNATIMRLAAEERHRAELALDAHYDTCTIWPQEACDTCRELAALAAAAAAEVGRLKWGQALAEYERARRNRRGRRPPPGYTGIRIPAPGQEQP